MTDIREHLAHKPLLFDGGMGTYYKEMCIRDRPLVAGMLP